MKKICIITGTRAEYGLLRWIMEEIQNDPGFELQIVATGMHLSPEFGFTYKAIEEDGFKITKKIEMLLSSDTPSGIGKSMGLGLIGFADAFAELSPDLIILLGDRFEIFAAASAALIARIPVAHLHGGERTEGAFDESLRHAITKMSHLHFVATEEYRNRVIQMGENPDTVFQVGGLGIDGIKKLALLSRNSLERELSVKFKDKNLMITFHPVTLENATAEKQMDELLAALEHLEETLLIFTYPNADTDGRKLIQKIERFVAGHKNSVAFTSLGQLRYLSCLQFVDGVIGNSSSGLIEVPGFRKGTINIGERQRGRIQAASVIQCDPDQKSILYSIQKLYSEDFQEKLKSVTNPYGNGGASEKIVQILRQHSDFQSVTKTFYDLKEIK